MERVIGVCPPRDEVVVSSSGSASPFGDSGTDLEVVVPSFRRDIAQEDDLVEEIIRVWGYDKIPVTLARGGELRPVTRPRGLTLSRAVSRALNAAGLAECVTYAFVDPDRLRAMGWGDAAALVTLQNPLSRERSVLRPSLMAGLLDVLAINANRGNPDARVFEIGHIFSPRRAEDVDRPVHEELWAGIALTGLRERRSWSASRERADVFDAKGWVSWCSPRRARRARKHALGRGTGPRYLEEAAPPGSPRWPRGGLARRARARRARGVGLPAPCLRGELSLTALGALPQAVPRYQPLPRFPAVQRDSPSWCPRGAGRRVEARLSAMQGAMRRSSRGSCSSTSTRATSRQGRRSLASASHLPAPDRTLTDRKSTTCTPRSSRRPRALRAEIRRMMAENLSSG